MKRPIEVYVLCLLLLFVSVGALYGGGALVLKPDGSILGMEPWLSKMPFPNFLLPGIILFLLNGVLPLVVMIGLLYKPSVPLFNTLNLYSDKHWSWAYSLYSGVTILSWIIIQQFLTDFFILQPIIALIGLLVIIITLLPRTIRYCSAK